MRACCIATARGSFTKIPVVGIFPLSSLADCSLAPSVPAARWKLQVSQSVVSLSTPTRGGFFSFDFMAGLVTGLKLLQEFTSQIH